jgi:hypothetical protein
MAQPETTPYENDDTRLWTLERRVHMISFRVRGCLGDSVAGRLLRLRMPLLIGLMLLASLTMKISSTMLRTKTTLIGSLSLAVLQQRMKLHEKRSCSEFATCGLRLREHQKTLLSCSWSDVA